ncbi:pregnancy zone protein-like [Pimephales promelas]|nr:pregnancy zone protein-like [Pimephales promelas]
MTAFKYGRGGDTRGQPVEVCRDLRRPCLTESAKTNATGCVSVAVDASLFFNGKIEERTQETRLVDVTREGTDTHGQPVPGRASVEACRDPFESILRGDWSRPCLTESAKIHAANPYPVEPRWKRAAIRSNEFCLTNATGCVSVAVDASLFFKVKVEEGTREMRLVNVTREGTVYVVITFPRYTHVANPYPVEPEWKRAAIPRRMPRAVAVDASLFFNGKIEERTRETRLVNVTREGTDTRGQPVPGGASVEACRDPLESILLGDLRGPCLTESAKTNATGRVSVAVDASLFFNANFEERTQETQRKEYTLDSSPVSGKHEYRMSRSRPSSNCPHAVYPVVV